MSYPHTNQDFKFHRTDQVSGEFYNFQIHSHDNNNKIIITHLLNFTSTSICAWNRLLKTEKPWFLVSVWLAFKLPQVFNQQKFLVTSLYVVCACTCIYYVFVCTVQCLSPSMVTETKLSADEVNDSPIEQVRLTVPITDDPRFLLWYLESNY